MARQRIGARRHLADTYQHNGNTDGLGNPTLSVDTDWTLVAYGWPCEILTTNGTEVVRGRQTTPQTTHVLVGEYFGGRHITADMRVQVAGKRYDVLGAYDPDGDNREFRVDAKVEAA